jgi:DNA-binding NarL/FixJ family response regulator
MKDDDDFQWPVAVNGYKWHADSDLGMITLVPVKEWPLRHYKPLKEFTGLFRTFAELKPDKETILAFANRYGPMGFAADRHKKQSGGAASRRCEDRFEAWVQEVHDMQVAIALSDRVKEGNVQADEVETLRQAVDNHILNAVSVRLLNEPDRGGLVLKMRPYTLRGALWLQLAQAVSAGKDFRPCGACGKWFELTPDIARKNRLFCSEACRSRAHRAKKEKAVELLAAGKSEKEIADELATTVKVVRGWLQRRQR